MDDDGFAKNFTLPETGNIFSSLLNDAMRPFNLCRERLERIQGILARNDGLLTIREFRRTYGVWKWEVEQAAELGWLEIETRKPSTGRPSRVVRKLSNCQAAKLPPLRSKIEKRISFRHWVFARVSVHTAVKGGDRRFFGMPPLTTAYQRAFPSARSRAGAAASMSRLLRHPHVRAARQWHYASENRELPQTETMPATAGAIWQRLREAGSWRVRYAPFAFRLPLSEP